MERLHLQEFDQLVMSLNRAMDATKKLTSPHAGPVKSSPESSVREQICQWWKELTARVAEDVACSYRQAGNLQISAVSMSRDSTH